MRQLLHKDETRLSGEFHADTPSSKWLMSVSYIHCFYSYRCIQPKTGEAPLARRLPA